MTANEPRPEHRTLNPHTDDITRVGDELNTPRFAYKLQCVDCRPFYTLPVRKQGDPSTVARCAQCGRKHSMDSVEITKHDRYE